MDESMQESAPTQRRMSIEIEKIVVPSPLPVQKKTRKPKQRTAEPAPANDQNILTRTPKRRRLEPKQPKQQQQQQPKQQVEKVTNIRKRENQHEYLVKWKNRDEQQWMPRDIMITEHPQSVIDFFQIHLTFH